MPGVFNSERFFREAWPTISQAVESPTAAASDVAWILSIAEPARGALVPGGVFVLDTRNRDQLVRSLPQEERQPFADWTLRIEHGFDVTTSRWHARWSRLPATPGATAEVIGESDIRLYSAHELRAMLRPERWSHVDLYGGLDGPPFSLDAPRLVVVARK
jgi:hypothetical protein